MRNTLQHPDFVGGSVAIVGIIGIVLGALNLLGSAEAHQDGMMSYPIECCSGQDCAPVEKVEILPFNQAGVFSNFRSQVPSVMIVTTKNGTAAVPAGLARRVSPDGRMHACIFGGKLICIFMPPEG